MGAALAFAAPAANAQTTVSVPLKVLGVEAVAATAFSPDGKQLASVDKYGLLRILNAETGSEVAKAIGPMEDTYALAWSPTQALIAIGDTQNLKITLWEAATLQKIRDLPSEGIVQSIDFTRDGLYMAFGTQKKLQVYETASWSKVFEVGFATGYYSRCVRFSPSGDRVLIARDDLARFYAVPSGAEGVTIQAPCSGAADLSPDGTKVVIAEGTGSSLKARLWDAFTGAKIADLFTWKAVTSARFFPDGTRIAFALSGVGAIVIDAATGAELYALRPVPGSTTSTVEVGPLALTPDGSRLALAHLLPIRGADGYSIARRKAEIALYDLSRATPVRVFPGDPWMEYAFRDGAISPDGSRVALAAWAPSFAEVRGFDAATGEDLYALDGGCLAFSPDGARIATGSGDGNVHTWEAGTGRLLQTYESAGEANAVLFSPDGTRILAATRVVEVWNAASGALLQTLDPAVSVWTPLTSIQYSPDGSRLLAVASDRDYKVFFWDTATWALQSLAVPKIKDAAFASGTALLVCYTDKNYASLLDISTGAELRRFECAGLVDSVAVSPDLTRGLTGSADGTMREWDLVTGALLKTVEHSDSVAAVAYSRDGRRLLSCSGGSGRIWDGEAPDPERWLESRECWLTSGSNDCSPAFSADGTKALTAAGNQSRLWNLSGGSLIWYFQHAPAGSTGVSDVALSPDGKTAFAGYTDGTCVLWNAATGALLKVLGQHADRVWDAAFSPDGSRLLTGSADYTAILWDVASGAQIRTLTGHRHAVTAVDYSPDGTRVLTASLNDAETRVWDASTGEPLRILAASSMQGRFMPDGQRVFTAGPAGYREKMQIWEVATGAKLLDFIVPTVSDIFSARVAPDGRHAILGGQSGECQIWDLGTNPPSLTRSFAGNSGVTCAAFSPDGSLALSQGRYSYRAYLWDTGLPPPAREARPIAVGGSASGQAQTLSYADFRLDLAPGQAANLVVRLVPVSGGGAWRLLGRKGAYPTLTVWDWSGASKADGSLEMVIPSPPSGALYVSAYCTDWSGGGPGTFQIAVEAADRYLLGVAPDSGGNGGSATLKVTGLGFTDGLTVELRRGGELLKSAPVGYWEPSFVTATLDLRGLATGVADVAARWPDGSALDLPGAFTVKAGGTGRIEAAVISPEAGRQYRAVTCYVEYENVGDGDFPAPLFMVECDQGKALRYGPEHSWSEGPLTLLGIDFQGYGTAGTLPPGRKYQIPFQVYCTGSTHQFITFTLTMLNPATQDTVDWAAQEASFRPIDMEEEVWGHLWAEFTASAGATWQEYWATLRANADYLSSMGRFVAPASVLAFPTWNHALGATPLRYLAAVTDAVAPAPHMPMAFNRYFSNDILSRFRVGPLGRGWSHSFDARLEVLADSTVKIWMAGDLVRFRPLPDGSYVGAMGEKRKLVHGEGPWFLTDPDGTVRHFGSDGRLLSVKNYLGQTVRCFYDPSGRLYRVDHSGGDVFSLEYDAGGRLASLTDHAGRVISYAYDASGEHLASVTIPGGLTTSYTYYPPDGSARDHALTQIAYPDGTHRNFEYDDAGRLAQRVKDDGALFAGYATDERGRATVTGGMGGQTTLSYDENGRSGQAKTARGGTLRFTHDVSGNLTKMTDQAGGTVEVAPGPYGESIAARHPNGNSFAEEYAYPSSGGRFVTGTVDANGNRTEYRRKAREDGEVGPIDTIVHADGSLQQFSWDAQGLLEQYTNRRGQAILYTRNARGQLTLKVFPDGTSCHYEYDRVGRLVKATDSTGDILLEYVEPGLVSKIIYPNGHWFAYQFDGGGRKKKRTADDGSELNYAYDGAGRLSSMRDGAGVLLVAYTYDAGGRVVREDCGNGVFTTRTFDIAGHPLSITHWGPGSEILTSFVYTYDAVGNITSVTTETGAITRYRYNSNNDLVGVTYPDGSQTTYTYDPNGNRTSVDDGISVTPYTANELNQYTAIGVDVLHYDGDGNLVQWDRPGGTHTFQYDPENRLVGAQGPGGEAVANTYNPLGHLGERSAGGTVTGYGWEYGGGGAGPGGSWGGGSTTYGLEGLGIFGFLADGIAKFLQGDATGSTRGVSGGSGVFEGTFEYGPFGEPRGSSGGDDCPYQFGGEGGFTMDSGILNGLVNSGGKGSQAYSPDLGRNLGFSTENFLSGGTGTSVGNSQWRTDFSAPPTSHNFLGDGFNSVALATGTIDLMAGSGPKGPILTGANATVGVVTGGYGVYSGSQEAIVGIQEGDGLKISHGTGTASYGAISVYAGVVGFSNPVTATIVVIAGAVIWVSDTGTDIYIESLGTDNPDLWYAPRNVWYYLSLNYPDRIIPPEDKIRFAKQLGIEITTEQDPNAKESPAGVGFGRWIPKEDPIPYTVHFENDPSASAPVQEMSVTDQLDPDLDWSTFRFTGVGWADQSISITSEEPVWETRLTVPDYRPTVLKSWWLDIRAELLPSGLARWTFRFLDPATGELPEDALAGFMPPEDGTGRGQGWVTYSVTPAAGKPDGTQITNFATIIFGTNAPMDTNVVLNTLGMPPVSASIGGMVFLDSNEDGIHNCQEPGAPGVVVTVSGGDTTYTVTADGAGVFLKEDLGLGDYTVSVDPKDPHLPSGATLTTGNNPASVHLDEGQAVRNVDFGFKTAAHVPGDCNQDGTVKINELMQVIAAYRGQAVGTCGADCDGSGTITIAELMRVVAAYHGQSVKCP